MCKCVFLMLCFGLNTGISIRHMQVTQSFVKFKELISKASWENIQDNLRSSPDKAHTLKQTMEKERQKMHSTDRHEDTTQAWWYMIYDSFTLWQVIKNGRKGNGRGFCLCVSVCGCIVTNWFSCGKIQAASLSCGDTNSIPARRTAYTLFYLNQLDPAGQPASKQCTTSALCLSLSAQYTMFLAQAQKCVRPALAQNEWRSTQTFHSIKSISLPVCLVNLDTSYRGSSQTSGNRTEPLSYGEGCQAIEKCVIAKDALVWFTIAGKYTGN